MDRPKERWLRVQRVGVRQGKTNVQSQRAVGGQLMGHVRQSRKGPGTMVAAHGLL
jgi:hypothetical protein